MSDAFKELAGSEVAKANVLRTGRQLGHSEQTETFRRSRSLVITVKRSVAYERH